MKEVNKQEELVIEQPVVVEEPKKEEPKVEEPKKETVKVQEDDDRPYMGYKSDELKELLEKWRDMFNRSSSKGDRMFSKNKVIEIEAELKLR